jgi:iron complex transport system permease protein
VIGFVGLIAPHLARAMVGADQRTLLPLSMLMGALLMLTADTIARTIALPAEVPVGIFTALLGGPFLMLLLRAARYREGA